MTKQKFLNLSILSLLVLALLGGCSILGGKKAMAAKREAEKQEMIEIVESEEAKAIFEDNLRGLEEGALSNGAKIQNYEIDYDSLEFIPSGGLAVELKVNNSKDLKMSIILVKDSDSSLRGSSSMTSRALIDYIRGE
ncbi:DUF1310 family protein [Streptococcus caprae]|uniref:DUF1310 family protein n=1 Tax=Streptococcus caprae TaxID=1640501 RepID=A0ABV8CTI1_9STRE